MCQEACPVDAIVEVNSSTSILHRPSNFVIFIVALIFLQVYLYADKLKLLPTNFFVLCKAANN